MAHTLRLNAILKIGENMDQVKFIKFIKYRRKTINAILQYFVVSRSL